MRNLAGCVGFLHTKPGEFVHVGALGQDMTILPVDRNIRVRQLAQETVCHIGDVKCAFDDNDKTRQKLCNSCNCDAGIWVTKHTWTLARLMGTKARP